MCKRLPRAKEGRGATRTAVTQSDWPSLAARTPNRSPDSSGRTTIRSSATPTAQCCWSADDRDSAQAGDYRRDHSSNPSTHPIADLDTRPHEGQREARRIRRVTCPVIFRQGVFAGELLRSGRSISAITSYSNPTHHRQSGRCDYCQLFRIGQPPFNAPCGSTGGSSLVLKAGNGAC